MILAAGDVNELTLSLAVRQPRGGDLHVREEDRRERNVRAGVRVLPTQVQVCLRRLEEQGEGNTEEESAITAIQRTMCDTEQKVWPDSTYQMSMKINLQLIGNFHHRRNIISIPSLPPDEK